MHSTHRHGQVLHLLPGDHSVTVQIIQVKCPGEFLLVAAVDEDGETEDEILYEFIDTFEQHHSDCAEDARDGSVSKGEWVEYYNNVSMSVDRDDYFELMMNQTWNLKGDRVTKKGWGAEI